MSIVTEFAIPAEAFALEHTFDTVPNTTIEVERLASHSRERVMPFCWVIGEDLEGVENALRNDPTVDEIRVLDRTADVSYVNVHWSEEVQTLVDQIADRHGAVREIEASGGVWFLELKFIDREAVDEFRTHFEEQDRPFELRRFYDETAPKEREYDLTADQREALITALEMGYFDVPREVRLDELAAEFDISTNAVSQRLRRAIRNLTRNTLAVSPPAEISDAN